jgi:hypothetical protein
LKFPWTPEPIPLKANVVPTCVPIGGTATIVVNTVPRSGIIYQAVYADGKGGSPPPYGGGYGGNEKGQADKQGDWSNSWVVGPHAPVGTGRIDVIVGTLNGHRGYQAVDFAVADASGHCA